MFNCSKGRENSSIKNYKIITLLRRRSQAYIKVSLIYDKCYKWLKSDFINLSIALQHLNRDLFSFEYSGIFFIEVFSAKTFSWNARLKIYHIIRDEWAVYRINVTSK